LAILDSVHAIVREGRVATMPMQGAQPNLIFTIGLLENHVHPEMVMLGMPDARGRDVMNTFLAVIAAFIVPGRPLMEGQVLQPRDLPGTGLTMPLRVHYADAAFWRKQCSNGFYYYKLHPLTSAVAESIHKARVLQLCWPFGEQPPVVGGTIYFPTQDQRPEYDAIQPLLPGSISSVSVASTSASAAVAATAAAATLTNNPVAEALEQIMTSLSISEARLTPAETAIRSEAVMGSATIADGASSSSPSSFSSADVADAAVAASSNGAATAVTASAAAATEPAMVVEASMPGSGFADEFATALLAYHAIADEGQVKMDAYWAVVRPFLTLMMKRMSEAQKIVFVHYSVLERYAPGPRGTYLKCFVPGGAHREGIEEIDQDARLSTDGTVQLLWKSWKGNYDPYSYTETEPPQRAAYVPVFPNSTPDAIRFVCDMFPDIPFKPVYATIWTRCLDSI